MPITMSCQPSPQPHASGMAASTASSGTATNSPTRNRSRGLDGSGSTSGRGARARAASAWPGVARPDGRASVVVIVGPRLRRGYGCGGYAYVTVTYESVSYIRACPRIHQDVRFRTPGGCDLSHHLRGDAGRDGQKRGRGPVVTGRAGRAGGAGVALG